jgi:hypothetical protein
MAAYYKISMQDGTKADLTLNLGAIAELSKKNKKLADRYFSLYKKMQNNQDMNELDMGEVIYIAYVCAHVNSEYMELQEFLYQLTDSREELGKVFQQLFGVQEKKQGFQNRSRKRRKA